MGPKYFLPWPTKILSLQFEDTWVETWKDTQTTPQLCINSIVCCCVFSFLFFLFCWIKLFFFFFFSSQRVVLNQMVGFEQILVGEEGGENRRENEGGEKGEEILVGPTCFLPKPTKIFIPQNWRDLSRGVLRKHSNYSFHCALTLLLLLCVCVCVCFFFFFGWVKPLFFFPINLLF